MPNVNASRNYLVWNNTEAVTYSVHRANGNDTPYAVSAAKRRPLSVKELAASAGAYTALDRVWLLPAALIGPAAIPGFTTPPLKPGDFLRDADGIVWTVLESSWQTLKSTWRLTCRDLVLAYDLRDSVTIQRAAVSTDAAGGLVRSWPSGNAAGVSAGGSEPYGQVPARVQLLTQTEAEERDIRGFKSVFAVTVGQQVSLTPEDRVKVLAGDWAGQYLQITGIHNPARIDELPILDCVLPP